MCPVSTGGGTGRVQLVRGGGGGSGSSWWNVCCSLSLFYFRSDSSICFIFAQTHLFVYAGRARGGPAPAGAGVRAAAARAGGSGGGGGPQCAPRDVPGRHHVTLTWQSRDRAGGLVTCLRDLSVVRTASCGRPRASPVAGARRAGAAGEAAGEAAERQRGAFFRSL
jgi:hypothetical protein